MALHVRWPIFFLPDVYFHQPVIQFQAEPDTDEVYAQITLLPEQDVNSIAKSPSYNLVTFSSVLTFHMSKQHQLFSSLIASYLDIMLF